jgi:hypothetical protein
MITVNDPYNLVPELFDAFPEFVKSDSGQVDVMLITSPETSVKSRQLTVLIDPEPNMYHADKLYPPLKQIRPNSLIVTSGYLLTNKQYQLHLLNSSLTVKNNPGVAQVEYSQPKQFLSSALLGCWSLARGTMIRELKERGLLENCIANYFDSMVVDEETRAIRKKQPEYFFNYRSAILNDFDHPVFTQVAFDHDRMNTCRSLPTAQPGNPSWVSQLIPWKVYQRSYMSIVAESDAGINTFFMSEKITKPLMVGHPFVVYGCRGYLAELRKLGFKTFSPWIDESYDLIDDETARVIAIIDSVAKFSLLSNAEKLQRIREMQPLLDHNRQLITNKQWLSGNIATWIKSNV